MGFAIADAFMGGTPDYAGQAQASENARQAQIRKGTKQVNQAFAGFNPQFYNQRRQAYIDYAMPQLSDQFTQTRNQIGFGLANKGLTQSGTSGKQWSDLFRQEGVAKQNIADTATSQSQALQQQVANSQANLINQLYTTADPASAQQSAIQTAAGFQAPSTFAPLVNQFSGLLNQYYISQLLNQKPATSAAAPDYTSYGSQFAPLPQPSSSY